MVILGIAVIAAIGLVAVALGLLGLVLAHAAVADALGHRKAAAAAGRPVGSLWSHLREVVRLARQPAHA